MHQNVHLILKRTKRMKLIIAPKSREFRGYDKNEFIRTCDIIRWLAGSLNQSPINQGFQQSTVANVWRLVEILQPF